MIKKISMLLFSSLFFSQSIFATDEVVEFEPVVSTPEIIEQTMAALPMCLEWQPVGMCFWLKCGFGCSINTSLKVKNYVPDLIVQAYNRNNGEPIDFAQTIIEATQMDEDSSWLNSLANMILRNAGSGYELGDDVELAAGQRTTAKREQKSSLTFYMVDVFGNPAILAFNQLANSFQGNFCQSKQTPFFMYYNSNADLMAWRWNYPEIFYPRSWIPHIDKLGGNSNFWGYIYPRMGFSVHQDGLKSALLNTYRVMHMVSGNSSAHVIFRKLETNGGQGYWPSEALDWEKEETGKFQMLYPDDEEDSCHTFPYSNLETNSSRRSTLDYSYVWNFWKSYKCCSREGQTLLFHFG